MNKKSRLIPSRATRARLGGISAMTYWRWVQKGILPPPVKINGRNYDHEEDVEQVIVAHSAQGGDK